jgi:hypothetical protein
MRKRTNVTRVVLPALGVVVVAGMCAVHGAVRPRGRGHECDHRSLPRRALTPLTLRIACSSVEGAVSCRRNRGWRRAAGRFLVRMVRVCEDPVLKGGGLISKHEIPRINLEKHHVLHATPSFSFPHCPIRADYDEFRYVVCRGVSHSHGTPRKSEVSHSRVSTSPPRGLQSLLRCR